eukprot:2639822-Pyramimonas_sp.AAC.1
MSVLISCAAHISDAYPSSRRSFVVPDTKALWRQLRSNRHPLHLSLFPSGSLVTLLLTRKRRLFASRSPATPPLSSPIAPPASTSSSSASSPAHNTPAIHRQSNRKVRQRIVNERRLDLSFIRADRDERAVL